MAKYTVKTGVLHHDKKVYATGETVELTEAEAAALPAGIVEAVPEEKPTGGKTAK